MGRSVLVASLVLIGVAACGQGGLGQHRLVGTVYEDRSFEKGFEMAFITSETVEVRMYQRTKVATCSWIDRTAEAEARGENTTFRLTTTGGRFASNEAVPTAEPAAYRIEVSCPLPFGSGATRFELAFAKDLNTATRLQLIAEISAPLFGSSSGDFDVGRALSRVGA